MLTIRDGGDTGGPIYLPGIEASMDAQMQAVAPEEPPAPPVQAGISTSQVQIRVDFALSK